MSRNARVRRPMPELHEEWNRFLRANTVSRRTVLKGAAAGSVLAATGAGRAMAATGSAVPGEFLVGGRHLSFGNDASRQMWVAGQLFNPADSNAVPPSQVRVVVDYGLDRSYGHTVEAEIRELVTHVPVWDGRPGVIHAARTLNADQFYVHALIDHLEPGGGYHYRFRYRIGRHTGVTPDATFRTAPVRSMEPFTFTAFADEGIPGPNPNQDSSLLPEREWGVTNDPGEYDGDDPLRPQLTGMATTVGVIGQINRVRNLQNGSRSRFNLLAGDICYANAEGDLQPIINPNGPHGSQPARHNTPMPAAHSGGWDYYDPTVWTGYFAMIEPSAASTPWMFATGNHDSELFTAAVGADSQTIAMYDSIGYGGHAKRLDLPSNGPSACPSVYQLSYGNVGVVSVDANDLSFEIQGLTGYSGGTQLRWVDEQLGRFRADADIDWIVVFFHECAFSTCRDHSSDGGVRAALAPLFSRHRVDLVVQGHNHLYERTNPIVYDAATNSGRSSRQAVAVSPSEPAEVSPEVDGTTYLVVGTAGTPRYGWSRRDETDRNFEAGAGSGTVVRGDAADRTGPYVTQQDFSQHFETVDWSQARYADYGFIALDVAPAPAGHTTTMTLRFINELGRELDRVVFHRVAGISHPAAATAQD
jgi:hypothetical protein